MGTRVRVLLREFVDLDAAAQDAFLASSVAVPPVGEGEPVRLTVVPVLWRALQPVRRRVRLGVLARSLLLSAAGVPYSTLPTLVARRSARVDGGTPLPLVPPTGRGAFARYEEIPLPPDGEFGFPTLRKHPFRSRAVDLTPSVLLALSEWLRTGAEGSEFTYILGAAPLLPRTGPRALTAEIPGVPDTDATLAVLRAVVEGGCRAVGGTVHLELGFPDGEPDTCGSAVILCLRLRLDR